MTQTASNSTVEAPVLFFMNSVGHLALREMFKDASYYISFSEGSTHKIWASPKMKRVKDNFFFVTGTGLDILLMRYGLNYDANELREVFFTQIVHHRELVDKYVE